MRICPLSNWMDEDDFNPGYLMRSIHLMPKKGDKPEWMHNQDYWLEKDEFPIADLEDGALRFTATTTQQVQES